MPVVPVLVLPFNSCCSVSAFPGVLSVFSVVPSTFCAIQASFWRSSGLAVAQRTASNKAVNSPPTPGSPSIKKVSFKAQLEVVDMKQKVNKHFPGVLAPRCLFLFLFAQFPAGQQPELLPTHPPRLAASNPAVVVPAEDGGTRPDL